MVEFLAARWGVLPWVVEKMPFVWLKRWFPVAVENMRDEGALGLSAMFNKTQ